MRIWVGIQFSSGEFLIARASEIIFGTSFKIYLLPLFETYSSEENIFHLSVHIKYLNSSPLNLFFANS